MWQELIVGAAVLIAVLFVVRNVIQRMRGCAADGSSTPCASCSSGCVLRTLQRETQTAEATPGREGSWG